MRLRRTLPASIALALAASLTACGKSSPATSAAPAGQTTRALVAHATRAPAPAAARAPAPVHRRPAVDPGSLPQTHALPASHGPRFDAVMRALWSGVVSGRTAPALPAFFPRRAYVQLKSIAGAESDWRDRLVYDYGLDLAAAHALLGAGASSARLLHVDAPSSFAHWIEPGVCDNGIGYYELPNARVVYRAGGQVRSFGIASLISWRGVWYVVHLGAILRPTVAGTVDEPAQGPGTPAYSGTC